MNLNTRKLTIVVSSAVVLLIAVFVGFKVFNTIPENTSDGKLYLLDQLSQPIKSSKVFAWNESALASTDPKTEGDFKCPAKSTSWGAFLSPTGAERSKESWFASTNHGFTKATRNVALEDLKPSGLILGSAPYVKATGGTYSLGLACKSQFAGHVDSVFYRYITVEAGSGTWKLLDK